MVNRDDLVLICALKKYEVPWLYLKVRYRLKWVNLSIVTLLVPYNPFLLLAQREDINAIFRKRDEVIGLGEHDAHDFTFPQLEGLMTENRRFYFPCAPWDIEYLHIIGVNVYDFVRDYKFSKTWLLNYENVSVGKVELIFPL